MQAVCARQHEPRRRTLSLRPATRRVPPLSRPDVTLHTGKQFACLRLEVGRAVFVARVGQQQREQHRPACGERSPRPPRVQRRRMAVSDRLLACGVLRDRGDGEVDFGETFAGFGNHLCYT